MLPPISVPMPSGLPWRAINALSPPLLPPGVKSRLKGFVVLPKILLFVSRDWGGGINTYSDVLLSASTYHESLRVVGLNV